MDWQAVTIGRVLSDRARELPDKMAFVAATDGGLTFRELDIRVKALAGGLASLGVGRGDPVALWMTNTPDWIAVWFACARLGAVLVPINTRYKLEEATYILRQSEARVLIAMDQYWSIDYVGMIQQMVPELESMNPERLTATAFPALRSVVLWNSASASGTLCLDDLISRGRASPAPEPQLDADDPAIIVYTSGTTGWPKGAVHGHIAIRNCANMARALHVEADDVILGHMPYYHVAGAFAAVLLALWSGCTLVTVPHWKPAEILHLIEREGISIMGGIPTHYIDLVDEVRRSGKRPTSLKTGWIGGATVTPEVASAARDELNMRSLQAVYGMTETTSMTTLSGFDDPIQILCDNKGKPIGEFEVAVVADNGTPVPTDQVGEVWVRGHLVMQGYYRDPKASAEVITSDGWFKTGDLGSFDAAGYLKITGRKKDMFIVGGSNAYPAEIERMLQTHPAVRQAVVVGVPDRRLGEVGFAFLELQDQANVDTAQLGAFCRGVMADYKVPRYFEFVTEFPKTTTGKIQRAALVRQAADIVVRSKVTTASA
jgi:fatty-acyl-CoA synthase